MAVTSGGVNHQEPVRRAARPGGLGGKTSSRAWAGRWWPTQEAVKSLPTPGFYDTARRRDQSLAGAIPRHWRRRPHRACHTGDNATIEGPKEPHSDRQLLRGGGSLKATEDGVLRDPSGEGRGIWVLLACTCHGAGV